MEQPNYYAVIPANVRYDKKLTDKAKLLYGEISALCNKNGVCTASNAYFANLYGVSNTTISTLINSLVKNGFLESEIIYKEGTKEIQNRYLKISKDPILKNQKDNNTSNNKKEIYKEKENACEDENDNSAPNSKKSQRKFIRPSLAEVQDYIKSQNLNVVAEDFYDYFEATDWVDSKGNKVVSWKGKLRTWNSYHKPKVTSFKSKDELEIERLIKELEEI